MQLHLNIENSSGLAPSSRSFTITENGKFTIGRSKDASWCLSDPTRFLSAIHCEIISQSGSFQIVDHSANGLLVNGQKPVENVPLSLGKTDLIEIGPFRIRASVLSASYNISDGNDQTLVMAQQKRDLGKDTERPLPNRVSPVAILGDDRINTSFFEAFAKGASVDAGKLAGRSDHEFAQELGRTLQTVSQGLLALTKSVHQLRELIGSDHFSEHGNTLNLSQTEPQKMLLSLFAPDQPGHQRSDQILGDIIADLAAHDLAFFFALQSALFRLLNELSPTTVENSSNMRLFSNRKSVLWDNYVALWAELSAQSDNGMLDVFLRYFKEAYDTKIDGI